jgi:hypothetical protein
MTPLHLAILYQEREAALFLINDARGIAVNARGPRRVTPLHAAAQVEMLPALRALVGKGAVVDVRDEDGNTPLTTALMFGQEAAALYLVEEARAGAWWAVAGGEEDMGLTLGRAARYGTVRALRAVLRRVRALRTAAGSPQQQQEQQQQEEAPAAAAAAAEEEEEEEEEEDDNDDDGELAAAIALSLAVERPPPLEEYLDAHAPESLICPISIQLMVDPVVLAGDGVTYSRAAIEEHFAFCRKRTCRGVCVVGRSGLWGWARLRPLGPGKAWAVRPD